MSILPDLLPPLDEGVLPTSVGAFMPEPEALAQALSGMRVDAADQALLGELGCPIGDLLATPAAARAGLLALRTGRAFTHHELRVRIPMPVGLEPEVAVWQGGTVPTWQDGVLAEPKYFSFFQDEPHSPFNPNHRAKWRSHELLHGVVGWCWHPGITRFELYLGARLAELLPVVHWYGLDELYRPRCRRHAGGHPPKALCLDCEQAASAPFWTHDRAAMQADAVTLARRCREHLATEWAALLVELDTGMPSPCPRPGLDSASDAQGYLRGHWNRLTAWSFGAWVERFCVPGVDHAQRPHDLARHVAVSCHRLCSGSLRADGDSFRRLRARRTLQDLGYRTLLVLEHAGPGRVEDALMPELGALAGACGALLSGAPPDTAGIALQRLLAAVDDVAEDLPEGMAAALGGLGLRWMLAEAHIDAGLDQLVAGLGSALPDSWARMPDPEETAWRFAASESFDETGSLATRFSAWWTRQGGADADLVALEAMVLDLPRVDHEADLFGVLPDPPVVAGDGVLRLNRTLRRQWLHASVLEDEGLACDRDDDQGRVEVAVAWTDGEPAVVVLDQELADALAAVVQASPAQPDALARLIAAGLVVCWPAPRVVPLDG